MAGKSAGKPSSKPDGRSRKRSAPLTGGRRKSCFFCKTQGRRDRLQEHRRAPPLHLGEGQDPLAADQRRLPPPPAPGRGRDQAGPRDGAAAVRGRGPRGAQRRPWRPWRPWRPRRPGRALAVEVVLRQDVDHVGLRGEVVNVARGYARNYLLPRGPRRGRDAGAHPRARAARRAAGTPRGDRRTDEAQAIATRLEATELRFDVNAGPTGSLFGSVTATNVADRLWEEQKIRIDRRKLELRHDQAGRPLHACRSRCSPT